jgi:hypothetical protein
MTLSPLPGLVDLVLFPWLTPWAIGWYGPGTWVTVWPDDMGDSSKGENLIDLKSTPS